MRPTQPTQGWAGSGLGQFAGRVSHVYLYCSVLHSIEGQWAVNKDANIVNARVNTSNIDLR